MQPHSIPYLRIFLGTVVPVLLYAVGGWYGLMMPGAILASAWSLLVLAFVYWRLRVWDSFSTVGAIYGAAELVTVIFTVNPDWYLYSPIVFGGCFGLFFLFSVAVRRPILRYFAEQAVGVEAFPEEIRASRHYMAAWDRTTCLWGLAYLLKAGVLGALLAYSSMDNFLIGRVGLGFPVVVGLIFFSYWYPRHYWESVFAPAPAE